MFEWGWVVEPDPDYQLSTFTCGKRSYKDGGNDLRRPVRLASTATLPTTRCTSSSPARPTPAKRAEIVKQMQQMLYDDAPYVVTYYYDDLEAYRQRPVHRASCRSPTPNGALLFQYGTWSYREHRAGLGGDGHPRAGGDLRRRRRLDGGTAGG